MTSLGFGNWPTDERLAVAAFLRELASRLTFVLEEDRENFLSQVHNIEKLPNTLLKPPAEKRGG
jgi:hypothetical protein